MRDMRITVSVLVVMACVSAAAAAQDRQSAFVGGSVSAANMESRTEVAYAGSFGFRFSRVVSFVIEATGVPEVDSPFPQSGPVILSSGATPPSTTVLIYPGPIFSNPGGRIVLLTNTARIDIPTTSTRLTPFFAAGGGVANVRRTADLTYQFPLPLLPPGSPTLPIVRPPIVEHLTASSTAMTLTLGGGVGVRVASSLWLDADLRLFRLLAEEDQNLGRFGVGVRYQF